MASQLRRSVATQSSTTNRAKNSSDDPRSFWPTITTSDATHAMSSGPRWRGSGRWSGPTFQVPAASSSRRSVRYAAKNRASAILANSPGWKLTGPMLTHRRAPSGAAKPTPGTNGSIRRTIPISANVHL